MRWAWLLVIAACGSREPIARKPPAPPAPTPVTPAVHYQDVHGAAITAPHGSRIVNVAVADTGDAALTADVLGELRLWPTLDGTREPVVVRGPRARQLAIAR